MYPFNYHQPKSIIEAVESFKSFEEAQWLAGGMTLLPSLKLRLASPGALIDLNFIESLRGVQSSAEKITIGAMTRHADVNSSVEIKRAIPALSLLAGGIGDSQVRNRGTIGGSISNNDPAADYPAAILGLNATIKTNSREIAADDYFTGMFETSLDEGEMIQEITFPVPDKAGYVKFPHPASGYAVSAVMVARFGKTVRVAVTGTAACVFRLASLEEALAENFTAEAADSMELDIDLDDINSDLAASAEYRANLTRVMARRAIEAAQENA
jgi:carbon-monoxide dehydrogenase medium subunit